MKSRPFSVIAPYYDILMKDIRYDEWVEYIAELYPDYADRRLRILDIACGTGVCAVLFRKAGHGVVALDSSEQMLEVARQRFAKEQMDIEVLRADMSDFSIEGKVDLVTCLFDSMNNLLDEGELESCFRCVADSLNESGLFIFDMNTEFGLSTLWGDKTTVKEEGPVLSIWRNSWDPRRKLATLDLTLFVCENDVDEKSTRIDEVHLEKSYPVKLVAALLRRAGLSDVSIYRHLTTKKASRATGRIMVKAGR